MPELAELYEKRLPLLQRVAASLEAELIDQFTSVPRIDRISFRTKGVRSFLGKAEREKDPYEFPLAQIEDQIAGRIIVLFSADVEPTVARLCEIFTSVEQDHHRPTKYNEFDYESHHSVHVLPAHHKPSGWAELEDMPTTFEMQVRTLFQHAYAEPQHDLGYKSEEPIDDEIKRELAWIAAGCWGGDQALERVRTLVAKAG
jgi:putative GTP pyrophosphokinase